MREVVSGVYQLSGFPPNMVNIYLVNDVLIDAGTRPDKRRIFRQLQGRTLAAHALTHAHPDHQGASKAVCEAFNVPLFVGEGDADAMASGNVSSEMSSFMSGIMDAIWTGPAYPVDRRLREGDEVAGFTVIETPGHSPGHISYWRETDRTLIAGDVFFNINFITMQPGLTLAPESFSTDPARNRESARKLAALNPRTVCFGHGEPLTDGAKLADFVASL